MILCVFDIIVNIFSLKSLNRYFVFQNNVLYNHVQKHIAYDFLSFLFG